MDVPRPRKFGDLPALSLQGRTEAWGWVLGSLLGLLFFGGLWARLHQLSAEGFADDEIHKWLAAQRYLNGDFLGDDIEHPMLMKFLITGALLVGRPMGWAPETITRIPLALAGALCVLVSAWLGRRLFGRLAGLFTAGLLAASPTFIGYNRVAKEDTLLGLFLLLSLLCVAEAKASADAGRLPASRRWEVAAAVAVGFLCASKYFFFLALIPALSYVWLRSSGTAWRISRRRWATLFLVSGCTFAALNWKFFLPSTWAFLYKYTQAQVVVHGGLYFAGHLYKNAQAFGWDGLPPWFYLTFAWVKLAPPTVVAVAVGLVLALWLRRPSHRLVLVWLGTWGLFLVPIASKWGRFFLSLQPALALLAGYAAASVVVWLAEPGTPRAHRLSTAAAWALGLVLMGSEARAAVAHAPHYRLYINSLGGGSSRVTWYFPHCDYFDAGFREAIEAIAARAEPGAEITTEIDWPARYYADRFGRPDLQVSLFRPGQACRSGRPCYVVAQAGRWYKHNLLPLERLGAHPPWHVERIEGVDVVNVYRLEPGTDPFLLAPQSAP
jgi:4-amino-4-deoxy-L-arabinose transferase-like glycosyltransferase